MEATPNATVVPPAPAAPTAAPSQPVPVAPVSSLSPTEPAVAQLPNKDALVGRLPVSAWCRVFAAYYDNIETTWMSGALTPLLVHRTLLPFAVEKLYRAPHVPYELIPQFHCAIARSNNRTLSRGPPSTRTSKPVPAPRPHKRGKAKTTRWPDNRLNTDNRAALVRRLTISASPSHSMNYGRGSDTTDGDVHRLLRAVLAAVSLDELALSFRVLDGRAAQAILAALSSVHTLHLRLKLSFSEEEDEERRPVGSSVAGLTDAAAWDQALLEARLRRESLLDFLRAYILARQGRLDTTSRPPLRPARSEADVERFAVDFFKYQDEKNHNLAQWNKAVKQHEDLRRKSRLHRTSYEGWLSPHARMLPATIPALASGPRVRQYKAARLEQALGALPKRTDGGDRLFGADGKHEVPFDAPETEDEAFKRIQSFWEEERDCAFTNANRMRLELAKQEEEQEEQAAAPAPEASGGSTDAAPLPAGDEFVAVSVTPPSADENIIHAATYVVLVKPATHDALLARTDCKPAECAPETRPAVLDRYARLRAFANEHFAREAYNPSPPGWAKVVTKPIERPDPAKSPDAALPVPEHKDIRRTMVDCGIGEEHIVVPLLPNVVKEFGQRPPPHLRVQPAMWLGNVIPTIPGPRGGPLPMFDADAGSALVAVFGRRLVDTLALLQPGLETLHVIAADRGAATALRGVWPHVSVPRVRVRVPRDVHPLDVLTPARLWPEAAETSRPMLNIKTKAFALEVYDFEYDERWFDLNIPGEVYRVAAGEWRQEGGGEGGGSAHNAGGPNVVDEELEVPKSEKSEEEDGDIDHGDAADDSDMFSEFSFATDASYVDVDDDELAASGGEGEGYDAEAARKQAAKRN